MIQWRVPIWRSSLVLQYQTWNPSVWRTNWTQLCDVVVYTPAVRELLQSMYSTRLSVIILQVPSGIDIGHRISRFVHPFLEQSGVQVRYLWSVILRYALSVGSGKWSHFYVIQYYGEALVRIYRIFVSPLLRPVIRSVFLRPCVFKIIHVRLVWYIFFLFYFYILLLSASTFLYFNARFTNISTFYIYIYYILLFYIYMNLWFFSFY